MNDPNVVWGALFTGYILSGLFVMSAQSNGAKPKGLPPGSMKMKQWEEADAKGTKWGLIWSIGLALLIGAWLIFAR